MTAGFGYGWLKSHRRAQALETQLSDIQQQAKRSAMAQHVSRQMEEIVREQKEISDQQREEAIQQRRAAEDMRHRSEIERQHAIVAQNKALISEKQAQEALVLAESQRVLAEHQRLQAEFSKRVADTLSYLALGRSLGSLASIQFESGNHDVANLLAYSSYVFTHRYKGDVFYPAVFQALTQTSRTFRSWALHTGALSCIAYMPEEDDRIVTSSTYGELMIHKQGSEFDVNSSVLISNNKYDFRDIYISSNKTIYAISRSGHLVIILPKGISKVIELPRLTHPFALSVLDNQQLLIVAEHDVAVLDMNRNVLSGYRHLNYKVTLASRRSKMPQLFDNQGKMHLFYSIDKEQVQPVPVSGQVTAFAESKSTGVTAYGMSDGIIHIVDADGHISQLVGHRSRISHLKVNGRRLYSSSYDGTINLWVTDGKKIDPVTLYDTGNWIMYFTFDNQKENLCIGDWKGNMSNIMMNVSTLVSRLRSQLNRDFTPEEWNFYVGENVPYESFLNKSGKEDGK